MFFNRKKYKLKHNFGKNNATIQDFMTKLALNSKEFFDKQVKNGQVQNLRSEHASMMEFISDVEEYLNYCQHDPNFNNIFNSISRLNAISVLPTDMRGVYGYTEKDTIYVNPNLRGNGILNANERTKLYVAHELGHLINHTWLQSASDHLNAQYRAGKINIPDGQLALKGFSLLDEAIVQNRAEEFAYFVARKPRPGFKSYTDRRIFNGTPYISNFDYYGELQAPALGFARTLKGIGSVSNDAIALKYLSDRALNPNFATNIINEYYADGQLHNLYSLLKSMGNLKEASYALFGMGDPNVLASSKYTLDSFNKLATALRDYRAPTNQK